MAVGIVTDSSCDLGDAELDGLDVQIVPLFIRFGTDEFVDREQITVEDFYRRMAATEELPQTAAPPPGRFEQAFRQCLDAGSEAVVCINLSAAISATMQSAVQAADAIRAEDGGVDIRVLDSRSVTAGLGTLVLPAARTAAATAISSRSCATIRSILCISPTTCSTGRLRTGFCRLPPTEGRR